MVVAEDPRQLPRGPLLFPHLREAGASDAGFGSVALAFVEDVLARFDCANDASENAWHLSRFEMGGLAGRGAELTVLVVSPTPGAAGRVG